MSRRADRRGSRVRRVRNGRCRPLRQRVRRVWNGRRRLLDLALGLLAAGLDVAPVKRGLCGDFRSRDFVVDVAVRGSWSASAVQ